MLQFEEARRLYEEMKAKAEGSSQSGFRMLFQMFLKSAADYAATRSAWATMDQAARNEDDKPRRVKHDAFIALLNAVSRNLGVALEESMPDRKTKGDFACYIALFMALEQR